MSQITKRALASALKELLEHKPLNKITIADITEQCGVNRQTFYYHFQDIYALLEWIYTTDAQRLLEGKRTGTPGSRGSSRSWSTSGTTGPWSAIPTTPSAGSCWRATCTG